MISGGLFTVSEAGVEAWAVTVSPAPRLVAAQVVGVCCGRWLVRTMGRYDP